MARTAIGLGFGVAFGLAFAAVAHEFAVTDWIAHTSFFSLLIPIRVVEWLLLLHWRYRDFRFEPLRKAQLVVSGIFTSFALDAIGLAAVFVIPGGVWVC